MGSTRNGAPEALVGLLIGTLTVVVAFALVMPERRGSGNILHIDEALPWMGGLAMFGAGLVLLSTRFAPAYHRVLAQGLVLAAFAALDL